MDDLLEKIDAATTRLATVLQQRAECEASAQAHEAQARDDRRRMTALKIEAGELNTVIQQAQVKKGVERAQAAAAQAQKDAEQANATAAQAQKQHEAILARLAEKEARLDEMLAKQ